MDICANLWRISAIFTSCWAVQQVLLSSDLRLVGRMTYIVMLCDCRLSLWSILSIVN